MKRSLTIIGLLFSKFLLAQSDSFTHPDIFLPKTFYGVKQVDSCIEVRGDTTIKKYLLFTNGKTYTDGRWYITENNLVEIFYVRREFLYASIGFGKTLACKGRQIL